LSTDPEELDYDLEWTENNMKRVNEWPRARPIVCCTEDRDERVMFKTGDNLMGTLSPKELDKIIIAIMTKQGRACVEAVWG
jgi:hypothetical protein